MKELAWHVTISEADCSNGPCTKAACPLNTNQKNICIQTIWLVHGRTLINSDMIPHLGYSQYRALISFIYFDRFNDGRWKTKLELRERRQKQFASLLAIRFDSIHTRVSAIMPLQYLQSSRLLLGFRRRTNEVETIGPREEVM